MSFVCAEAWTFYDHLTLHVVPGPRSLSYLIPLLILPAALLLPPSVLSHTMLRWVILPVSFSLQTYIWFCHDSFDVISINHALWTFTLISYYDVRKDFKRIRRIYSSTSGSESKKKKGCVSNSVSEESDARFKPNATDPETILQPLYVPGEKSSQQISTSNVQPYPPIFSFSRVYWILVLITSLRLSDFYIGTPSHDLAQPTAHKPTRAFFKSIIYQALFSYVLLDLTSYLVPRTFSSYEKVQSRTQLTILFGLNTINRQTTQQALFEHALAPFILLVHFYSTLSLLTYLLPVLLTLPLHFINTFNHSAYSPTNFPSHFSHPHTIWTSPRPGLRAFWGTFWHQNMRYTTSTPGLALSDFFHLRSGSVSRYMLVVTSAFFFSGVVHMGVVPPQPLNTVYSVWQLRVLIAMFFWLQVLGLGVEVFVEYVLSQKLGIQQPDSEQIAKIGTGKGQMGQLQRGFVMKVAILGWVIGYLAVTAWWTLRIVGRELRWWSIGVVPLSMVRYFCDGSAWTWT